ncbi:hypothetical protein [Thiohalobacter sp.]|uniref:hypothetical protein n=1 Tax=Thiohalobacter sp. TaxID=2025948 RepID=UPI00262156DE|nr:hypothetical protein [Thiohalobacter sp.]
MFYTSSRCTRYVLLFEGRTGSSYLTTLLDAHPRIHAMKEGLRQFRTRGHDVQARWVREVFHAPPVSRIGCRGFKTKLRDIADPEAFSRLLQSEGPRVLFMRRRNRIKCVVSQIRSRMLKERTNHYNAYRQQDRLPPVAIPTALFDRLLRERERLDAELESFVEQLDLPRLDIFYEDILIDEVALKQRVLEFLGVPHRDTRAQTFKNTSDDLRESVTNLEALKANYADTPYEPMFDEVLVREP